jgi:general secretion pathway protein M
MKNILLQRWRALSKKEQTFLGVTSAVFALLFLYAFLWLPIDQGRANLAADILSQNNSLLQMQSQAAEIERRRNHYRLSAQSIDSLQTLLAASAKSRGITLDNLTAASKSGNNAVDFSIKQIDFNNWVAWVDALQSEDGIRLAACTLKPAGKPGQVMLDASFVAKE